MWIDEAKTGQEAVTITPTTVTMTREAYDSDNKVHSREKNRLKRKVNRLRRDVASLTEQLEDLVRRKNALAGLTTFWAQKYTAQREACETLENFVLDIIGKVESIRSEYEAALSVPAVDIYRIRRLFRQL